MIEYQTANVNVIDKRGKQMAELLVKQEIRKQGSFSDFARKAGMHVSSVSQIVNGHLKPYPGQVDKIVDTLGWKDDPAILFKEIGD